MTDLILVNRNDLTEMFKETIREMFPEQSAPTYDQKDFLSFEDGLDYINEKGISISKSTLYKRTSMNEIPFRRFGARKIMFEPNILDAWINDQLSKDESNVMLKDVARSARRKERLK